MVALLALPCCGCLVYGLVHEDVLLENLRLWTPAAAFDLGAGLVSGMFVTLLLLAVPSLCRYRRLLAAALFLLLGISVVGVGTVAGVGLLVMAVFATGETFWPIRPVSRSSYDSEQALVAFCVGFALWSLGGWWLMHLPVNSPFLYALLTLSILLAKRSMLADLCRVAKMWLFDPRQAEVGAGFLLASAVSLFFVSFGFLLALFPTVGFDAMAQHQRFLNYVWFHGVWDFSVERNGLQIMPGYMENYFYAIAGFMGGGEDAGRLAHGILFLSSCAGMWLLALRERRGVFAPLAVAVLASSPMVQQVLGTLHAEVAMMFSVVCIVIICGAASSRKLGFVQMVGAGVCLSLPTLLKVNGALISLLGAMWFLFFVWRQNRAALPKGIVGCAMGAGLAAPLFLAAYLMTGNPVYPMYNNVFKSPLFPAHMSFPSRFTGHLSWDTLYGMIFHTGDYCEMGPGGMGFHFLLLVPLAAAAPLVLGSRSIPVWTLLSCYTGAVLANAQYVRYLVPVAPLAILLGLGVVSQWTGGRIVRRVCCALILVLCALNLLAAPSGFVEMRGVPLRWLFSKDGREAIMRKKAPVRAVGRQISAMAGGDAVVAFLGYPGGCDVVGTVHYSVELYSYPFYRRLLAVRTVEDFRGVVSQFHLGHVVVRKSRYSDKNSRLVLHALSILARNRLDLGDYEWFIL